MALLSRHVWITATVAVVAACAAFGAILYPRNIDFDERLARAAARKEVYDLLWKGTVYQTTKDYDGALAVYEEALAIDDTVYQTHNLIGLVQLKRGDLDAAYEHLNRACNIWQQNADAMNTRGVVKWMKGDRRGARKDFASAVNQRPEYKRVRANLAHANLVLGDRQDARRELEACIEGEDNLFHVQYALSLLGVLNALEKNYSAADSALALASDPKANAHNRPAALYNRAKVLDAMGETERANRARAEFEQLMKSTEDANAADSDA